MKTIITGLLVLTVVFCHAQDRAIMKNDTLFYQGNKFFVNHALQLFYGSGQNKDFVYVWIGSGMSGMASVTAAWSKSDILIDKVYFARGKYYCRAKVMGQGPMLGNKIFFDVEGAVDNKEIH